MTILACVPAPDYVVLGGECVLVADGLSLAMATNGALRLLHPTTRVWAEASEICAAALQQFPRERPSTVGEFARAFARGCGAMVDATAKETSEPVTLRALIGGVAPSEKLAAAFEVVLVAGQAPRVTRVFEPFVGADENTIERLASFPPLRETIDSATTLLKNPPPRKVARLVRKLLAEAGAGELDAVVIARDGATRVSS